MPRGDAPGRGVSMLRENKNSRPLASYRWIGRKGKGYFRGGTFFGAVKVRAARLSRAALLSAGMTPQG